jgi:hypothetical protein
MSECIKTGARVLLQEYGLICAADIHSVPNNIIVIKFNPDSLRPPTASDLISVTHQAMVGFGFYRQDEGILVIPDTYIVEIKNGRG